MTTDIGETSPAPTYRITMPQEASLATALPSSDRHTGRFRDDPPSQTAPEGCPCDEHGEAARRRPGPRWRFRIASATGPLAGP